MAHWAAIRTCQLLLPANWVLAWLRPVHTNTGYLLSQRVRDADEPGASLALVLVQLILASVCRPAARMTHVNTLQGVDGQVG
jgi:Zn-dependent protease